MARRWLFLLLPLLLGAVSLAPRERPLAQEVRFVETGKVAVLATPEDPHPLGIALELGRRRLAEPLLARSRAEVDRLRPRARGCARRPTLGEA
ncbi:MAG: hypothetical protein D6739_10425, partial [Nitrospirae bacterium]